MSIDFRLRKNKLKRKKVYIRDNFTCQECGWSPPKQKIPNNYKGTYTIWVPEEDNELQIDHIVPQAKGGTDHIKNLQTLCEHCNNKKNDRIRVGEVYGQTQKTNS
jgi:5-methylcytosine-specific restriction enzyme A